MVIIKFCQDYKTDLKTEIGLMVHDLHDLLIYVNECIALLMNFNSVLSFKAVLKSLQHFNTTVLYQFC